MNIAKICAEIINYWGNPTYMGLDNMRYYLNMKYGDLDEQTRHDIEEKMSDMLDVYNGTIDADAYGPTEYEFVC